MLVEAGASHPHLVAAIRNQYGENLADSDMVACVCRQPDSQEAAVRFCRQSRGGALAANLARAWAARSTRSLRRSRT